MLSHPPRQSAPAACGFAVIIALSLAQTPRLLAQTSPPATIHEDTLWTGQITINRDISVRGATVQVEPGSTIRFIAAGRATVGPVIRLGGLTPIAGRAGRSARLVLAGTADRPIVVETPAGKPPGAIAAGPLACSSLVARHVLFRRLGTPVSAQKCKPAILLTLTAPENDLWIADCRFESCGPVRSEFFGPGASAHVARSTFADTVGPAALVLTGSGNGLKVAADNVADAAFKVECPNVLLRNNVLIGQAAAVIVPLPALQAVAIVSNYVHCTMRRDDGHYALKCEAPDAIVSENVLVGGTYVIETAPRTVTGNVLIGVAGLEAAFGNIPGLQVQKLPSSTSTTHYLITNLAPDAVVTDNLLLGPAIAALTTGRDSDQPRIEHNLFDGWGSAKRAVHFNRLVRTTKAKPLAAVLSRNVITRYRMPPVFDEARQSGTLAEIGHNLFAEVPEVVYERIRQVPGPVPTDRRLDAFSQLGLESPAATQTAANVDDRLLARQISVSAVRDLWLAAYRPRRDSALTPAEGAAAVGPRPSALRPPRRRR